MKIKFSSVYIEDQATALKFYTEVLRFVKKTDLPVGDFRWLTVISPDGPDNIELLIEPNDNPAVNIYQKAIFDQGIPLTAFAADNIHKEYHRMQKLGVAFCINPTNTGETTIAVFDDTDGNLIKIFDL